MRNVLLVFATVMIVTGLAIWWWPEAAPPAVAPPVVEIIPRSQKAEDRFALIMSILDADAETLPGLWESHQDDHLLRPLLIESWGRVDPNRFPDLPLNSYGDDDIFWTSAVRHHGGKILEISKGRRQDDPFVLAQLACHSPQRALEIFGKNPERFEAYSSLSIKEGVLIGLAKQDAHLAIDYYLGESTKDQEDSFHERIRDWLVSNPEDALRWIAAHDAFDHSYHFEEALAYLSRKNSELMASLAKTLPTSRKKHLFEKVLSMEEIPRDCLWYFENRLTSQERQTTHSFRSLLKEAMECPASEFKEWWSRNLDDYLSETKEALVLGIIRDRWITFAPAECVRYQVSRFDRDLVASIEEWLKADEMAAMNFPSSLDPISSIRSISEKCLIRALGKTDVPKALAYLTSLPGINPPGTNPSNDWIGVFEDLARRDREAFLKHAPMEEGWRATSMAALTHAWLAKDFTWTMETLKQLEADPEALARIPLSEQNTSESFTKNYHFLSPDWQKALVGSPYLYEGLEKEWLLKKEHPQISAEDLEITQFRAADSFAYSVSRSDMNGVGKDFQTVMTMIKNGNWLSKRTRTKLTERLLSPHYPNLVKAEKMLATIPFKFHGNMKVEFDLWQTALMPGDLGERVGGPEQFIEVLQSAPQELDGFRFDHWRRVGELAEIDFRSWTRSDFESVEAELEKLSLTATREAFGALKTGQYWTKIAWDLFSRSCHLEDLSQDFLMQSKASYFANRMAEKDCPAAGEWLLSLPPSGVKNRAIAEVFRRWQDYSKTEALAWAKNLPDETQRFLGVIID